MKEPASNATGQVTGQVDAWVVRVIETYSTPSGQVDGKVKASEAHVIEVCSMTDLMSAEIQASMGIRRRH